MRRVKCLLASQVFEAADLGERSNNMNGPANAPQALEGNNEPSLSKRLVKDTPLRGLHNADW